MTTGENLIPPSLFRRVTFTDVGQLPLAMLARSRQVEDSMIERAAAFPFLLKPASP